MGTAPPIQIASIGMWDTLLLMVLALVVFGPRRLPAIGRQIGKLMYEFRKASNDFKFQMEEEFRAAEDADRRKKEEAERQQKLAALPAPEPKPESAIVQNAESAAEAVPSPYPGEGTYPAAYTEAERASEMAAQPAAVEQALTIQPPSTGETVAAERPGAPIAEAAVETERTEAAESNG